MARSLHSMFEMRGGLPLSGSRLAGGSGAAEDLAPVIETIGKLTSALQAARAQGVRAYGDLGRSAQEWSNVATKAASQVLTVLTRHALFETSSVTTHSKAEQAKSLATLSALKQTAVYKAIAATAAGFQALGSFDFWAAAQDFTSAALWGALAGGQIAAMAAGGAGSAGAAGRFRSLGEGGAKSLEPPVLSLAAGAASAAHPPGGSLTVAIMGDNEAGEWLAKTLNTAVEQRGVQLTSTRSTRSAYAQG